MRSRSCWSHVQRLGPRRPGGQVGGEHPRRAERMDHLGHADERVAAVEVDEALLVVALVRVVELLGEPLLDLGDHLRGSSELKLCAGTCRAGRCSRRSDSIASATPGYCTLTATARSLPVLVEDDGPVDLADRCRGDRLGIPLDEDLLRRRAELLRDHLGGEVAAHRRGVRLQLGEREANRLGKAVVEVARHLPDLHQGALHVAEALGDVFGGAQLSAPRRARLGARRWRTACGLAGRVDRSDADADPGELEVACRAAVWDTGSSAARRSAAVRTSRRRPGDQRAAAATGSTVSRLSRVRAEDRVDRRHEGRELGTATAASCPASSVYSAASGSTRRAHVGGRRHDVSRS